MTRPRDSQRSRLYNAEGAAGRGKDLSTVPLMQEYVDTLLASRWFRERWGTRRVRVMDGRGRSTACGCASYIKMPTWSRYELVVLHEVAHGLVGSRYAAHGPEFAGVFLLLVEGQMGKDAGAALRAGFKSGRVKTSKVAIPTRRYTVPTQSEVAAKVRATRNRPNTPREATEAAEAIRRAVRVGVYGPSGSKPRLAALATARLLDLPGAGG